MPIMKTNAFIAALGIASVATLAWLTTNVETTHAQGSPAAKTIVLIGGAPSHSPGEHDHPNGIKVLQAILESSPDLKAANVKVQAYPEGWPADESVLANAATVVWYFDGLQKHPMMDAARRARFQKLMDQGVGLVTLHQASTVLPTDKDIPLPNWVGGARYGMFDRTTESVAFQPPAAHPIGRAVGNFTLHDEFYPTIRFPANQKVIPILPGTFNVEFEDGKTIPTKIKKTDAAWAFERPNGGRGFAFTGVHYLVSLDHPQLRRLLLNAIAWTAKIEVPPTGIRSGVPDAATKVAQSVGAKAEAQAAPRTPQSVVAKGIVTKVADQKLVKETWGELTFMVNRELKNSDTMTVLKAVIHPGQMNGRHYHPNCDEILTVIQGHIIHTVNDQTFEMRAGDVLTVPQGAMHNARNIGTEDAILIVSYNSADRVAVGE